MAETNTTNNEGERAQLMALAEAYDTEDAAQCSEPSPWKGLTVCKDDVEWIEGRIGCAKAALDAAKIDFSVQANLLKALQRAQASLEPFSEASNHLHPANPLDGLTLDGIAVRDWHEARGAAAQARAAISKALSQEGAK